MEKKISRDFSALSPKPLTAYKDLPCAPLLISDLLLALYAPMRKLMHWLFPLSGMLYLRGLQPPGCRPILCVAW